MKERYCFTCGIKLFYQHFFENAVRPRNRRKFGIKIPMIGKIWQNDIFELRCCKCHHHLVLQTEYPTWVSDD